MLFYQLIVKLHVRTTNNDKSDFIYFELQLFFIKSIAYVFLSLS